MATTRRDFLLQSSVSAFAATTIMSAQSPELYGAPRRKTKTRRLRQKPTLIVIYLRGGADPLGTIAPYGDKNLAKVRPNLTMPGPDSNEVGSVLPLDDIFGFNPNMKALHNLYEKKMCAPIVCVGSPHPTRSHFDAQDFMERAAPGLRNIKRGWLNKYLSETESAQDANLRSFSLQSLLPRSLRGDYPVLARPDQKADLAMAMYSHLYPEKKMMSRSKKKKKEGMGSGTQQMIRDFGQRTIQQLKELNEVLEKSPPTKVTYPTSRFGKQFHDIAKIVNAERGLEIAALDYGGWDHHINQGPTDGQLGKKLGDVSDSIGAFVADVGEERMKKITILVMSEFGRTVRENGNEGSDHGHGGFMLAVGGSVKGGKVYGKWTGLEKDKLYQKRDLPVHTDFRLIFAETLKDMYGFDGMKLGMFPQYSPQSGPLDFLKTM